MSQPCTCYAQLNTLHYASCSPPDEESPMAPARVILNSLLGLLLKCEDGVLHMLQVVETINIPEGWENIDIIKQTLSLMVKILG